MERESVEKFLLKAFNWYYEERMWNTNISNEEALELFKETDTYQDFYNKASDDATSQCQALNLAGVSAMLPDLDIDKAEQLAMETVYAFFAVEDEGNEINIADAGGFFLEGYNYAKDNLH